MKKKSWISLLIVLALSTILLLPIPKGHTDSGARVYRALTYKIVQWNQQVVIPQENGELERITYQKTSVYWFPDHFKSIDELWKMEAVNLQ